uniref:Uncharacterized protein n=1 Tax=Arundo donax TaxID=35708 RepID=A0A0A8YGG1_ARUDO
MYSNVHSPAAVIQPMKS